MHIPTKDELFETQLKYAVRIMIRNDPQFQGMRFNDAIYHLELSGESLEDYIEMNPKQFGQAMAAVTFVNLGSDSLADLVRERNN